MTQISTHEAKIRFSELLASVEQSGESVLIFRYGHPIARLMPVDKPRRLDCDPVLSRVEIKGDLFGDDSACWESMHGVETML